jgi:hypothetical protein
MGAAFLLLRVVIPSLCKMDPQPLSEFLKTFNGGYLPWFAAGGIAVGITG